MSQTRAQLVKGFSNTEASADAITVDSGGNVGINATPEAWSGFDALEVNEASIVSSGSGDAFFTANAYYDGAWKYKDAGVARNIYMNSDGIVFRTAPSGSADGAITWTECGRWREGGGLTFNGDTAAANGLDDYEEGTWTPVIKSGTNTISYSGGNQVFRYTKIGRKVTVFFSMNGVTTSGTTGGNCTIEGMPFAMASDVTQERTMGSIFMFYNSGFRLASFPAWPHMNSPNTKVEFYNKSAHDAQYAGTNVNQVGSDTYCFFQITYQVA